MNFNFNAPIYRMPMLAIESQQQSMYQQSTYLDQSQTAVVVQQSHMSQSSWSMSMPSSLQVHHPQMVPNSLYFSAQWQPTRPQRAPMHGRFTYMPNRASNQNYAAGSADGQTSYMQQSRGGFYMPRQQQQRAHGGGGGSQRPAKQLTRNTTTQTYSIVKRCRDAAIQTDVIEEATPLGKYKHQATNTDEVKRESSNFSNTFESTSLPAVQQSGRRNSEIVLPQQRLKDLTHISLMGSDIAERLSMTHCQRPCFKKIDTLCARLKQDLLRPDGVLPNINSQGIAWAVKDFIFVFTRIVNCWIILKGYIYNTPPGLDKIKDELPIGFMTAFDLWQICTLTFAGFLIRSFVNLNTMLQKQKNSFCNNNKNNTNNNSTSNENSSESNLGNKTHNGSGASQVGLGASSTPHKNAQKTTTESLVGEPERTATDGIPKANNDLKYMYTMVKDSEEAQRCVNANGTYLKTGTYTPLKKDDTLMKHQSVMTPISIAKILPNATTKSNSIQLTTNPKCAPQPMESKLTTQASQNNVIPCLIHSVNISPREMGLMLYRLSGHIMKLTTIDKFFNKQFTLNYFRDFYERCQHQFTEVRIIILKCEGGAYNHINQAIHDLRRIVYVVSKDLKLPDFRAYQLPGSYQHGVASLYGSL
ncbi:protein mitoshell isoform X2 [Drosophila grimshawi]|uniref:protein mitoshell isoform X2 n=1 Tax=Drosophila grimshawi TaxID=7222 RepID=UPI000C86E726|nr:protein mitoshell isoform X2 [Drosophila grimshawi]